MSRNSQLERVFVKRVRAENTSVEIYETDFDEPDEIPATQKRFHLFHWYFLAGYYTLIVPFKIKKKHDGYGWETKSFTVQKWFLNSYMLYLPIASILLIVVMRFAYNFSPQATMESGQKRFFLCEMEGRVALINESSTIETDDMYSVENIIAVSVELALKMICFCKEAFTLMCFYVVIPVTFWYASKRFQLYTYGIYTPGAGSPPVNKINNPHDADRVLKNMRSLEIW
ncbi:unnamed protein product [Orchesella dallaii]|uniref:Innexin n=1 Tax=Orchesella dallaii TaxID=48710 RepID=A0ABP1RPA2_9HEXA